VRITFIQKGSAYQRHDFSRQLSILKNAFPAAKVTVLHSEYHGHAFELAATASGTSDYLIAVGGDGTLHEVVNGSMSTRNSDAEAPLPVFGVMPFGRNNDFIHALNISGDMDELCGMLEQGSIRLIDLGRMRFHSADGGSDERFFVNVTDVGIGASVLKHLVTGGKYLGGNLKYLEAILASVFEYKHIELRVETDEGLCFEGKMLAVIAANGRCSGEGLCFAPGARLDDGRLFISIIHDLRVVDLMRNLHRFRMRAELEHKKIEYHSANWMRVKAIGGVVPVQADGEFLGNAPLEVDILPREIRFLGTDEQ
jgi:YegS/Rv2252/BmrU family lipid kinase